MWQGCLSLLFSAYNKARMMSVFRDPNGRCKRSGRALGLLMAKDQYWRADYSTTLDWCDCRDAQMRSYMGIICKHRQALWMEARIFHDIRATERALLTPFHRLKVGVPEVLK